MDFKERLAMIRTAYAKEMPRLLEQWESNDGGRMDPYFIDWVPMFTPIEMSVWQDIRGAGLPLLPQVPALQYFLDFGNPFVKIAIECDGKQWHNAEKDAKRDKALIADGWTIYRLPGHVCNRILPAPWEVDRESVGDTEYDAMARAWFTTTATGVMYAIEQEHFARADDRNFKWINRFPNAAGEALYLHRSEPA